MVGNECPKRWTSVCGSQPNPHVGNDFARDVGVDGRLGCRADQVRMRVVVVVVLAMRIDRLLRRIIVLLVALVMMSMIVTIMLVPMMLMLVAKVDCRIVRNITARMHRMIVSAYEMAVTAEQVMHDQGGHRDEGNERMQPSGPCAENLAATSILVVYRSSVNRTSGCKFKLPIGLQPLELCSCC